MFQVVTPPIQKLSCPRLLLPVLTAQKNICDCVLILKSVLDLLFRQTFHPPLLSHFLEFLLWPRLLAARCSFISEQHFFTVCCVRTQGAAPLFFPGIWLATCQNIYRRAIFLFLFLFISFLWDAVCVSKATKTINTSGKLQMCGEKNPTFMCSFKMPSQFKQHVYCQQMSTNMQTKCFK